MSNKKILLNRRHNTSQKISGRSRKSDGSYGVHCMKGRGQNRREKVILSDECVKLLEEYKFMYMKHYHDIHRSHLSNLHPP